MTDTTRSVRRGETVYAHVRADAEEAKAKPEEEKKNGPPDVGEDDDLLVFRKGGITFHDLGTRLRSTPDTSFDRLRQTDPDPATAPQNGWWNEYVEIPLEAVAFLNDWRLFPDDILPMNDQLLGGDPFGFSEANGSGRKVPNCMPLPYSRSEWLHVDAVLYGNSGEARHVVGVKGQRPRNDETFDAAPADKGVWKSESISEDRREGERWNPLNPNQGDNGVLQTQIAGKHLKVDSRLYYEGLDTGDSSKYVWTTEPSASAPEVAVPKMVGQRVRVFLRPRVQMVQFGYAVNAGAGTTSVNSTLVTRLPVYPLIGRLWRNIDRLIIGTPVTPGQRFVMTRGFIRAMSAELERSQAAIDSRQAGEDFAEALLGGPITSRFNGFGIVQTGALNEHNFYNPHEDPDPFFFPGAGPAALEGMLVGAVEIKDTVYYAWLREDDQKNDQRMDIWQSGSVETGLSVSLPDEEWELTPQYLQIASDDDTASGITNTSHVYQEPVV